MKLIQKKVVTPRRPGRAPVITFVTYIHPSRPILMRRIGWEIADDLHDDLFDSVSEDNGKTWSAAEVSIQRSATAQGYRFVMEGGAVYSPKRDRLVTIMDETFQPSLQGHTMDSFTHLRITNSSPAERSRAAPLLSDFGIAQGIQVSFCHPLEDSRGRILVPVQWQTREEVGGPLHKLGIPFLDSKPELTRDFGTSALLIGTFDSANELKWQLGKPVPCALEKSSRGFYEGTIAELKGGRFAMILRGSNHLWPDRPSYKWVTFSDDGGVTWTETEPFSCDDGTRIESSSTGSALFRSIRDGALYWIGNLCMDGERPYGWGSNFPRSPIVIARVQENPFALVRNSITVLDRCAPGEDRRVQHSNFRFYQDRETGDVVLYLTRYGERGYEGNDWLNADQYEYRVSLP